MGSTNFQSHYIKLFGIVMAINFPLFLIYQLFLGKFYKYEIVLRIICTLCASLLIVHNHWPTFLKKKIAYIWYFTITLCLPFFFTSLLLLTNFSVFALTSFLAAAFFLLLITSVVEFIVSLLSGILVATIIYILCIGVFDIAITSSISDTLSNFIATIIIAYIFALKRDHLNFLITRELKHTKTYSTDLEIILKNQNLELQAALKSKDRFLNNMSHELRTPLHSVLAFTTFLKEKFKTLPASKNEYYLEQIIDNATRLNLLVSDLIDLSYFKKSSIKLDKSKINIIEIVQHVAQTLEELYKAKISISYTNSENFECFCDKYRIMQVLEQLILNAIKFSRNQPIQIAVEKHKYYLKILIIEEFEEGSRTKSGAGGKGIGLAICKHIITAHCGYISAENNNGPGSTFTVSLPVKS